MADYPVQMLCEVIDLPSSTYYYRAQQTDDLDLRAALETIAVAHPRYGSRRMTEELKRTQIQIRRKTKGKEVIGKKALIRVSYACNYQ